MQQRGEPHISALSRRLAHGFQSVRRDAPARCPDRGRLAAVSLGRGPSLHDGPSAAVTWEGAIWTRRGRFIGLQVAAGRRSNDTATKWKVLRSATCGMMSIK